MMTSGRPTHIVPDQFGESRGQCSRSDEQKSGSRGSDRAGVVVKLRMHSSHDSKYKDKKLSVKVPEMS